MRRILALGLVLIMFVSTVFVGSAYSAVKLPPLPPIDRGGMEVNILELGVEPVWSDGAVVLKFYVVNHSDKPIILTFSTNQTFDYWLMGEGFFYHFAEGKYFLQVITQITVKPGEKKYIGFDKLQLKSGRYRIDAQLKGYPQVKVGGYLVVSENRGAVEFRKDTLSGGLKVVGMPVVLKVDIPSYVISQDGLVKFDIYLTNTSTARVKVELPTRPINLTIFGGYSMYFAYTSAYDKDGKYLKVLLSAKDVELNPGASVKLAAFEWDQTANVRGGGVKAPYYRVHVSMSSATVTVSGKRFGIQDGKMTVVFPLYKRENIVPLNVPEWAGEYASYATEHGLLIPNTDKGVDFSRKATRRQVIFAVATSVGLEPISSDKSPFKDIQLYDPMLGILNAMKQAGLVKGYPDGTVRLDNAVTRAEAVSLFVRAILYKFNQWNKLNSVGGRCGFVDVKENSWYAPYVCYAYQLRLVKGIGDNRFEPLGSITVAQLSVLATTAHKLINMVKPPIDQ